jgi:hypothetical protein
MLLKVPHIITSGSKKNFNFCLLLICVISFFSCTKKIDLDLPADENRIVIESYLTPGNRFGVALQRSVGIVSNTAIQPIFNALVIISYGNVHDTLKPGVFVDRYRRAYNFSSNQTMPNDTNLVYQLYVKDSLGNVATATTKLLPVVPIDSVNFQANSKDSISVGFKFRDPGHAINYYRRLTYKGISDTAIRNNFRFNDLLFNGQSFSLFTNFIFQRGDTVNTRLYNLTKDHSDFLQSIGDATVAANNPLTSPVLAKGNIVGGLGIFTALAFDEKRFIVPR